MSENNMFISSKNENQCKFKFLENIKHIFIYIFIFSFTSKIS